MADFSLVNRYPGQEIGPPGQGPAPLDVHQPGGDLLGQLLHPSVTVFDQLYRTQPEDAWFNPAVSPSNPVQFEIGSFRVPQGVHLWMQNYEFSVYRQSGVDAGDFLKCEDDRFSGSLGFDITINGQRPASLLMQLEPVPVTTSRGAFGGEQKRNTAFSNATGNSFAGTSSQGLSLLPARRARQGAPAPNPFSFVVKENQNLTLTCVIFRPLRAPVAFVQAEIQGYLWQANASEALLNRMRPR